MPLIKDEDRQNWLERKLQSWAQLDSLVIRPCPPLYFYKKDEENPKGHSGKIVPVTFEGVLIVQEPDKFIGQVQQGIGPAKAFGCGLLSVAKV